MGTLARLSLSVSRTSIGAMIVCTIAVYIFHLGDWTFLGIRIYDILVFVTMVALFNAFLLDLVFAPGVSGQAAMLSKQSIMLSDDGSWTAGQISFANEVIDAFDRREKAADRLSAIIGVICYFFLGPRVGSPIAEYVTLAMLMFLPGFLPAPLQGQLLRMEALEPSLFHIAYQLCSKVHMSIMNGTIK